MTTPRSSLDVVAVVVENLFPVAETLPPVAGTLYPLPKPLASRATPHLREPQENRNSMFNSLDWPREDEQDVPTAYKLQTLRCAMRTYLRAPGKPPWRMAAPRPKPRRAKRDYLRALEGLEVT